MTAPSPEVALIGELITLQELAISAIESLSEDFTGEARHTLHDLYERTRGAALPEEARLAIIRDVEKAQGHLSTWNRNVGACSRTLQEMRRRLANEVALRTGMKPRFPLDDCPPYSQSGA